MIYRSKTDIERKLDQIYIIMNRDLKRTQCYDMLRANAYLRVGLADSLDRSRYVRCAHVVPKKIDAT